MARRFTLIGATGPESPTAWTRRAALARMGGALAAAGGSALLPALRPAAAAPTAAAAAPVVISVVPDATVTPVEAELIDNALAPLLAANPGLQVRFFPQQLGGEGGALETFMVAGVGPDIFGDFILTGYVSAGLALDLTPFVKQDNINLNEFIPGQLQYIRQSGLQSPTNPDGLYALPCTGWPNATAVNLGMLDDLGLAYPEPDWTYRDWTRLWEATTRKAVGSTPARVGLGVGDLWDGYNWGFNNLAPWVLWGWGGEYVDPTDSSRSYLNHPATVAAGEWAWNLYWNDVISATVTDANFAAGSVASINEAPGDLAIAAQSYGALKWDFCALPVWPVRKTSYTSSNFDGIWAGTKHPDAAWTVLKWFTMSAAWQRLQMRTLLYVPSRIDQYPEWVATVQQVMPPLRTKNMNVYLQEAESNDMYTGLLYRYASNEAETILNNLASQLAARRTTVAEGFLVAAKQLDALQSVGRAAAAQAGRLVAAYQREVSAAEVGGAAYRFPAPPRSGVGSPPAADAAQVGSAAGRWTVEGGGAGINGGPMGLTFAAAADSSPVATYVCRLTAIQAVKPAGQLVAGARFGLLACGDLSDQSANVGVEVVAGSGVHFHGIPYADGYMEDQYAGAGPGAGLIPAAEILANAAAPAANYLTRPVWLKLERRVSNWTAYASLDGSTWEPAGVGSGADMAGCWIGLFVTANASGDLVRATFDHLQGFAPDTFVRIGAP